MHFPQSGQPILSNQIMYGFSASKTVSYSIFIVVLRGGCVISTYNNAHYLVLVVETFMLFINRPTGKTFHNKQYLALSNQLCRSKWFESDAWNGSCSYMAFCRV